MTIRRTEFEVVVKGADATAKAFDGVAAAEDRATGAANRTGDAIDRAAKSAATAAASVPRLGDAFERVTGPTGKVLQVFNDVGDVFRLLTAGLAGGALFGGLADIADAMGALADKAGLTAMRVDQLVRSGGVLSSELVARKLEVTNVADAMERYAKSIGAASASQLTFREQQAALQGIATGRIKTLEGEQKAAENAEQAIQRARSELARFEAAPVRFTYEIRRAGGEREYRAALQRRISDAEEAANAADRAQRGLLGREGANPWVEGVQEFGASLVTRTKLAVEQTAWGLRNQAETYAAILAQRYRDAQKVERAARPAARTAARPEPAAADDTGDLLFALPGLTVSSGEVMQRAQSAWDEAGVIARQEEQRREEERQRQERLDQARLLSMMSVGRMGPEEEPEPPSLLAVLTADDDERARFEADMETVSASTRRIFDATQQAANGARQLGQAMGMGLSQAAAAALLTGGSFKKLANDVLKSIAVQAAGLAIFETAKGLGYLAFGNFASAALSFQSAAMYGAVATFAGVGAAATGGLRSGGSARSMSAGAAPSMGGTSQYAGGGSGGATVVQVYISGEQVTRAVRVEQSRAQMSGGITGRAA